MVNSCVSVNLSREDATYNAGDVISGVISVTTAHKLKVKDVSVHILGSARVSWTERRSFTRGSAWMVSHRNTDDYVNQVIHLRQPDKGSQTSRKSSVSLSLQSVTEQPLGDVHNYEFRFTLPTTLPSSFDGKWGQVHYGARVVLERQWSRRVETHVPFYVIGDVNVNKEPDLQMAAAADGDFKAGILCCGRGLVGVQFAINRRGYTVGDTVEFSVIVDNQSQRKLHEIKVALVQHVMFRVGSLTKRTTKIICSATRGETAPMSTLNWEGGLLDVPEVVPTSRRKLIHIKYTITVFINYSIWTNDYALPVPVVVGTVPVKLPHRTSIGSSSDGVFRTGRYNGSAILYSSVSPICPGGQRRHSEAVLAHMKVRPSDNVPRPLFGLHSRQTSLPDERFIALEMHKQTMQLRRKTSTQTADLPEELCESEYDLNRSTTGLT